MGLRIRHLSIRSNVLAQKTLTVIRQSNQGAAAARNKAFSVSHGDYIQWLDADDLLAPDKIAQQMEAREMTTSARTLFSSAWGHFIHRMREGKIFAQTSCGRTCPPLTWLLCNLGDRCLPANGIMACQPRAYRSRRNMGSVGCLEMTMENILVGWCEHAIRIRFVPQAKMFYRRVTSNRLSHVGLSDKKLEAHFLAMQLQMRNIRALEDSPRVRSAACMRSCSDL